ncbi:hypothetical protein [Pseudonocardia hierapolitana]|uniref:hypothetical protein n=1 Tax=Pseudonocardia hierapolitana TaxID=1128676 RepID=UPI0011BDB6FC|nr:hypothetical protein [Pseudonocardia hierapolitana]
MDEEDGAWGSGQAATDTSARSTARCSPFHHEIFAVVSDESAPAATVEDVLWPGHWYGDLLFSRAGVRVRAPGHLIDPVTATTSTLYFTFRREPRRTNDLSHGWGSNSQWGTEFPRFYSDAEGLHLNWDGRIDIGTDGPVPAEAIPARMRSGRCSGAGNRCCTGASCARRRSHPTSTTGSRTTPG